MYFHICEIREIGTDMPGPLYIFRGEGKAKIKRTLKGHMEISPMCHHALSWDILQGLTLIGEGRVGSCPQAPLNNVIILFLI